MRLSATDKPHATITRSFVMHVITKLEKQYPDAHISLNFRTPWELLVAVILSAQCTDRMVNKVTKILFMKYPSLHDYSQATPSIFEQDIKPTGFFHVKARHIIASAKRIEDVYGGRVPQTMEELLTLPGVARKTANVILGTLYKTVVGIVVDTHVLRITQRLRFIEPTQFGTKHHVTFLRNNIIHIDYAKNADAKRVEATLMSIVPKRSWYLFSFLMIEFGRDICKASKPQCHRCPLRDMCPSSRSAS